MWHGHQQPTGYTIVFDHAQSTTTEKYDCGCVSVVTLQSVLFCLLKVVYLLICLLLLSALVYVCTIVDEMRFIPRCASSLQLSPHTGCNREDVLCSKTYNETVHATMHNAFATTQNGFWFAQHRGCMRSALIRGIRSFMLDVHMTSSGNVALCHYSCTLGSMSLSATLDMFMDFLKQNPREIITIIWEMVPNTKSADDVHALHLQWKQAIWKSGMPNLMFARQQDVNPWPTLLHMIQNETRVVSFSSLNAPYSVVHEDWEMYTGYFQAETPFDSKTKTKLEQNCIIRNTFYPNWYMPWTPLLIMNQFTVLAALGINADRTAWIGDWMDKSALQRINGEDLLWARVHTCAQCLARMPNFIAVDFWDSSGVVEVVHRFNNMSHEKQADIRQGNITACSVYS